MGTTIRLKEWRHFHELSQRELARKAGLAVSTINALETGKREPNWQTLRKLAAAYGVVPANLAFSPFHESLMAGRSTPEEREAWVAARMPDTGDVKADTAAFVDVLLRAFLDGDQIARDVLAQAATDHRMRRLIDERLA